MRDDWWVDGIAKEGDIAAGQRVVFDSPIGQLGLVVTPRGLQHVLLPRSAGPKAANAQLPAGAGTMDGCTIQAIGQIREYLQGERRDFELPLDLTSIRAEARTVLDALRTNAPFGKVITYGQLAAWSGCLGGAREVGQIMARNPLPLVIPCHRVVATDGLGGYGGGLALKRRLLRLEGALMEQLSLLGDA